MKMDLKKLDEVSILSEKLRTSGLTEEEEKRWCELNSELTGFPEDFFTKTFDTKLNDILKRTDDLLRQIDEQTKETLDDEPTDTDEDKK